MYLWGIYYVSCLVFVNIFVILYFVKLLFWVYDILKFKLNIKILMCLEVENYYKMVMVFLDSFGIINKFILKL